MNIMFIQPPMPAYGVCTVATYPSLGQAIIASYLDDSDSIKLLDGLANPQQLYSNSLEETVKDFKPVIVGIRVMFINYYLAMEIASRIKRVNTNIIVVVGGPHVTLIGEEILKDNNDVDILICGEGEYSFPEIVKRIKYKTSINSVPGIMFRSNYDILINNQEQFAQLGEHIPRYDILDMDYYKKINFMTIEGKRGCDRNCLFCGFPKIQGSLVRMKEVDKVIEELREIYFKYGITKVEFLEPNFTIDKNWVLELCDQVQRSQLCMQFVCRSYVEMVDREMLMAMSQAGFRQIFYGIESGSQRILNEYRRPSTNEKCIEAIRWTKEVNIKTSVNFLIGAPSETPETVNETIVLAEKIKADEADVSILAPFPNTDFYFDSKVHLIDPQWYKKKEYVSKFPWFVVYDTDLLSGSEIQSLWLKAFSKIVGIEQKK